MGDTSKSELPGTRRWSFGSAAFDERAMQLFVGGRAVELELKPLEVLRHLLHRPGQAISKDDLVRAVWPGRVISDSALTSTIAKLRDALGDEQDAVRTIHGFGYRLDAEVRAGDGKTAAAEATDDGGRGSRRLTAVMFTDLVGYSALAHRDEALAIELLELHRQWVREILPRHGGREIETVGDAFLVEFAGALAAVECAMVLQHRFATHNAAAPAERRMQLRIGIHAADVEHKDGKIMGDGVNIASRIHGMAEPGGICVSEDVHRTVRTRRGFHFESLGIPDLKNIAAPPALYRVLLDEPAHAAPAPRRRLDRRWLAGGAVLAALAVAVAAALRLAPPVADSRQPSVAVLPFTAMSAAAEDAYFTDGMHDTILTHLSRVRDLKVISRTSVMRFRDARRDVGEIARTLGVDHVVEGSVQRSGNRLRINVQLIDARDDRHVWAENYDRDLADAFAVQSDVAERIAVALSATLAPEERRRIETVPSRNAEAYDLYLRALAVPRSPDAPMEPKVEAIGWLDRAVALDPEFAQAHVLLSALHDQIDWSGLDTGDARRLAGLHAERALALAPELAEARIAMAVHLYHGSRDYAAALAQLETARKLAPGDASVHFWLAAIYRRQGRWEESLASDQRVMAIDPLNTRSLNEHARSLLMLRRYDEAATAFARERLIEPGSHHTAVALAYLDFLRRGDPAPVGKALDDVPAGFDPDCDISQWRASFHTLLRRFDRASAAVQACPQERFWSNMVMFSQGDEWVTKDYALARLQWLAGDRRPPALAVKVRQALERQAAAQPRRPGVRLLRAMTDVMLGEHAAALAEAERAAAMMPVARDAIIGLYILRLAAEVHANAGAQDRALAEVEELLRLPAGIHAHELRLDPIWDPLRQHPRFRQLLAEHLPPPG